MAEPDATLHAEFLGRLHGAVAARDEALSAVSSAYAEALAMGSGGDGLYDQYLEHRGAVTTRFRVDVIALRKEYADQAAADAPPLPESPSPAPAFPRPPRVAPEVVPPLVQSIQPHVPSGLHSWQTPTPAPAPAAVPAGAAKSPWRVVLGIAVVGALLVGVTSWATAGNRASSSASSSSSYTGTVSATRTVTYEVVGGATKAGITYSTPSGTSQATVAVPLKTKTGELVTFEAERGEFVYLSAQNKGTSGNIICRISVDGVVISTNTSSGSYAIASCDGTVR